MKTIRLTMGQALVKFLDNQYLEFDGEENKFVKGVFSIFGHGNVTGLGAALEEERAGLRLYQGRNEQGMAHAAMAYAKQKNRREIIACTSSIGPGALNMVTTAGTATVNRIPLLLLPGDTFACRQPDPVLQQVEDPADHTITANDAFKPVSKYWDRVNRPEQLMTALINAMRVLTDPAETGTVTLCLPQDVQAEAYDYPVEFFAKRVHHVDRMLPAQKAVERAAEIIKGKKNPIIICGGGAVYSEARTELQNFAETFNIPFGETQAGKGLLPWNHSHSLGGIGVTGTSAANEIARDADLVIAVGTRLSDFTTASKWAFQNPDVEVLAINVNKFDAMKMNASFVQADAAEGLKALTQLLQKQGYTSAYQDEIKVAKEKWDGEVDRLYGIELEEGLSQTRVLGEINNTIGEDAIIVGASGSLPGDLQRVWRPIKPKTYHMEYGFSCMGYEISGAFGAKIAAPEQEVYVMVGDGSYLMLHSELVTSIQEGRKINVLLFDNQGFGCIHNLQRSQGIPTFGTVFRYRSEETGELSGDCMPIDFAANARSYGAETYTVTTIEELKDALTKVKESKVSTLIDIKVLPDTMTDGYENWWRVGVPEVANRETVLNAHKTMLEEIKKTKKY
ncbi:3D-(3,5/4)-trihydroxycyclohexane-1,2-dione acylhydrolase (decyclizing) [Dethiobacter alkaliphilus]|uniref:3D-(3,5/4)-trihydroxycyclohexane-1,2-dione acylhydrolase (decyclizing) n=1 Tax=Dethiobacter alkaliphilus TaxID=427926 RepID=UPI0022272355|nr:3D-(3,5/4)-trihydroxycyclohexane-1,2-dione acylhydrolase (decyclizing) [Dethiobacter alkaliphilus]MCW3489998.1 3D-(3,5/4)-trihydroxycyclohexane-1,2-dione acylhydrolase (decyclizing) [Dethiobacter alkaliphilus]